MKHFKKQSKDFLYTLVNKSGYLTIRDRILLSSGKTWCTVLLYHRVDENIIKDPVDINILPHEFEIQMREFSRNYSVISVRDLLQYLEDKKPFPRRTICITFDDSYLSIYKNAIPVLYKYKLPACFFINDDYVEWKKSYPWDVKYNIQQEMMSWDHVKEIVDLGFEIGVHTSNHLDLGKCEISQAKSEIVNSKSKLEDKLGLNLSYFSFPFGKPENFRMELIDFLKENELRCCFSAFGGRVNLYSNPYFLHRLPYSRDYWSVKEFCADIDNAFSLNFSGE